MLIKEQSLPDSSYHRKLIRRLPNLPFWQDSYSLIQGP
jgi:hypothetical protein